MRVWHMKRTDACHAHGVSISVMGCQGGGYHARVAHEAHQCMSRSWCKHICDGVPGRGLSCACGT